MTVWYYLYIDVSLTNLMCGLRQPKASVGYFYRLTLTTYWQPSIFQGNHEHQYNVITKLTSERLSKQPEVKLRTVATGGHWTPMKTAISYTSIINFRSTHSK